MSKINFKNPEVEAKFEVVGEADVKKVITGHNGPISKINLATAEKLLKSKDPHIKLKAEATKDKKGSPAAG